MFGNEIIILEDCSYLNANLQFLALILIGISSVTAIVCLVCAVLEYKYGVSFLKKRKWKIRALYNDLLKMEEQKNPNPDFIEKVRCHIRDAFTELGDTVTLSYTTMHIYLKTTYSMQLVFSIFLVIAMIEGFIFIPHIKHSYIVRFSSENIPIELLEEWQVKSLDDGTYQITEKN